MPAIGMRSKLSTRPQGDRLAVEDAGARAQAGERLDEEREAVGQVATGAAVGPNAAPCLRAMTRKPSCLVQPRVDARRLR